jgi:hypothetical protein
LGGCKTLAGKTRQAPLIEVKPAPDALRIEVKCLWNAKYLPRPNQVNIGDAIRIGDGPHVHPIPQRDAVQVLSPHDLVGPAAA